MHQKQTFFPHGPKYLLTSVINNIDMAFT